MIVNGGGGGDCKVGSDVRPTVSSWRDQRLFLFLPSLDDEKTEGGDTTIDNINTDSKDICFPKMII